MNYLPDKERCIMQDKQTTLDKLDQALSEIRPFLIKDGGDITLVSYSDDDVLIKFEGNCSNCKINNLTLNVGVKQIIKKYLPNIKEVKSIE